MTTISANGLALEYESLGNPSNPAVVLVMGLGVQLVLWPDELCNTLVERGFHVVRFDNRDAGLSTQLNHLGTPNLAVESIRYFMHLPVRSLYKIDDMAADTVGLMDSLGLERAHLVGMSMGGMIAQNVAAKYPQRVMSLASIMSTTGRRSLPQPTWRARRALLRKPPRPGDTEGAIQHLMHTLRTIGSRTYPWDEARLREVCERHVQRGMSSAAFARQITAIAASGDRTSVVASIKAPTLVLHGDEDPLLPPAHGVATERAIRAGGGHVSLSVVRGMGHDLPTVLLPQVSEAIALHCRNGA